MQIIRFKIIIIKYFLSNNETIFLRLVHSTHFKTLLLLTTFLRSSIAHRLRLQTPKLWLTFIRRRRVYKKSIVYKFTFIQSYISHSSNHRNY